jgi:hypothetical protein
MTPVSASTDDPERFFTRSTTVSSDLLVATSALTMSSVSSLGSGVCGEASPDASVTSFHTGLGLGFVTACATPAPSSEVASARQRAGRATCIRFSPNQQVLAVFAVGRRTPCVSDATSWA